MPAVLEDAVYMVRLLTFVPGERVETVPFTTQLIYQLGQTLASVNNALQVLSVIATWKNGVIVVAQLPVHSGDCCSLMSLHVTRAQHLLRWATVWPQ